MVTIEELYRIYRSNPVISTDTRKITRGCMFFALKGEHFDANEFAETAIEQGAAYAVVDNPYVKKSAQIILVDDVLKTLQELARHHRSQLNIPFIGITGTNGKTTTKELVYSVLSQGYKAYATQGNLNNHIGVPLTILSITSEIEIAIIEMGANHQKEIEFLCQIAQPGFGLITNVGKAHLEGFGGFEGVKLAKGELYGYLKNHGGTAFINSDNPNLEEMRRQHGLPTVVTYGTAKDNYLVGELVKTEPLTVRWTQPNGQQQLVEANLTGTYNFENILAAITLGSYFRLTPEQVNTGISTYVPTNNRSQLKHTAHNTVICDYYNANPSSMSLALENLENMQADSKAFILGDMFELGAESADEHQVIVEKALSLQTERRVFIGNEFLAFKDPQAEFYATTGEAQEALKANPIRNSTILVKGSRGMKLENLLGEL